MFFIFDVETIPDFKLLRKVLEHPAEHEDDLVTQAKEELGKNADFLPPMYHQIVAWVGLWIENNGSPRQKTSWHGKDEQAGLKNLFDVLGTYKDFGIIHHDGGSFDLPLLTYRAMKYNLQMPIRLNHYDIRYRYSNDNIDLQDEFSNYGASARPRLKHLGYLIDTPFKQTADSDKVLAMFRHSELSGIEHHCHEDVMATYIIWLHLQYTVGDITKELFDNLNGRATTKLKEIQEN